MLIQVLLGDNIQSNQPRGLFENPIGTAYGVLTQIT